MTEPVVRVSAHPCAQGVFKVVSNPESHTPLAARFCHCCQRGVGVYGLVYSPHPHLSNPNPNAAVTEPVVRGSAGGARLNSDASAFSAFSGFAFGLWTLGFRLWALGFTIWG